MNEIEVRTGARLHFGLLCGKPDSDWHYGGVGMMIQSPGWQLKLARSTNKTSDCIQASDSATARIANLLAAFRQQHHDIGSVKCSTIHETNFHSGLGSGTQLTLALATGLLLLSNEPRPSDISAFAAKLGRSKRSSIGTFGFDNGGFIVDRGKQESVPAAQRRIRIPEKWRMILLTPTCSQGLSGQKEENFFGAKEYLDDSHLKQIVDLINASITPALERQDYDLFSVSLARYGRMIGDYYASGQGGIFSSPIIRDLASWLKAERLPLPVQSSWGPTVCIPAMSSEHAESLVQSISDHLSSPDSVRISITSGLNSAASVRTTASEDQRSFG